MASDIQRVCLLRRMSCLSAEYRVLRIPADNLTCRYSDILLFSVLYNFKPIFSVSVLHRIRISSGYHDNLLRDVELYRTTKHSACYV